MVNLYFKCHNDHDVEIEEETENYYGCICKLCDYPIPIIIKKECNHNEIDLLVQYKNGTLNGRKVCTKCLTFTKINQKINPLYKYEVRKLSYMEDLQLERIKKLSKESTPLRESIQIKINKIIENKRKEDYNAFWDSYDLYINSKEWKEKTKIVLARDNYLCQACRINKATQVHHLTYKCFKKEPLFDLISICKPCHDQIPNNYRK